MRSSSVTPVVVFIGSHGSGRKEQARRLANFITAKGGNPAVLDAEALIWSLEANEPGEKVLADLKEKVDWNKAHLSRAMPNEVVNSGFEYLVDTLDYKADFVIIVGPTTESQAHSMWTSLREADLLTSCRGVNLDVPPEVCVSRLNFAQADILVRRWTDRRSVMERCRGWLRPIVKVNGDRRPDFVHRTTLTLLGLNSWQKAQLAAVH